MPSSLARRGGRVVAKARFEHNSVTRPLAAAPDVRIAGTNFDKNAALTI